VKDFLRQLAEEQEEKEEKETQLKKTTSGGAASLGQTGFFDLQLGALSGKPDSKTDFGRTSPPGDRDSDDFINTGRILPQATMTSMLDEMRSKRKGAISGPPVGKSLTPVWQEYIDTDTNQPYYVNIDTGASQWDPPAEPFLPAQDVELTFVEEDEDDESKLSE